ncbi:MAG: family lipase [Parcubacteria group bacterium]|nr:family lipase [Parcubacteria group bacterium]
MKIALIFIGVAIALLCAYWSIRFYHFYTISKGLVKTAVPYENRSSDFTKTLLVLGDSTAAGVGATTPADSLPARVARAIGATYVENQAISGAVVADLPNEISEATRTQYDFLLVQIGANDITKFHGATVTANNLANILATAPKASHILVISAGDVGQATLFPEPIRPFYTNLNKQYHTEFARVLSAEGYTYVDLSKAPGAELFSSKPEIYLAADGFHPSSAGYGLWFEAVQPYLNK